MLSLAIKDNEKIEISDFEINSKLQPFTYETLDYFKEMYKDDEIFLVIGADNLNEFTTWKNYKYILENYKIIVFKRNDIDIEKTIDNYFFEYKDSFILIDNNENSISSSLIRDRLKQGEDVSKYLDKNVLNYIKKNNLYK